MKLRNCKYCDQLISTTALFCPGCRKTDDATINWLNSAKKAASSIAVLGLAFIGPNALAGAILGPQMNLPSARVIRKLAEKLRAIDSLPMGPDFTIFFSSSGWTPVFLYDMGSDPAIPPEFAYTDILRVHVNAPTDRGEVNGYVEYKTPKTLKPPRRPKPLERILIGKALYAQLVAEADRFERDGPPATLRYNFSFEGENAWERAQFVAAKFTEYSQ